MGLILGLQNQAPEAPKSPLVSCSLPLTLGSSFLLAAFEHKFDLLQFGKYQPLETEVTEPGGVPWPA